MGFEIIGRYSKTFAKMTELERKTLEAVEFATNQVGATAAGVMKEQIIGRHPIGTPRPDNAPPNRPMSVTGALRRNIRPIGVRGLNQYSVIVGSTQIYAKTLELGFANGARYPIIAPTMELMTKGDRARKIYLAALKDKLKM